MITYVVGFGVYYIFCACWFLYSSINPGSLVILPTTFSFHTWCGCWFYNQFKVNKEDRLKAASDRQERLAEERLQRKNVQTRPI